MLSFGGRPIWLYRGWVDMRCQVDRLAQLVEHHLQRDPYAGDVFVFLGRNRRRVKLLTWDTSAFLLRAGWRRNAWSVACTRRQWCLMGRTVAQCWHCRRLKWLRFWKEYRFIGRRMRRTTDVLKIRCKIGL